MTAYHVDVHHLTHTCPANPEPHPYDTRRTIVAVAAGGPCRRPVTVRSGDTTALIACARHMPREQRCPACRITVIEHAVTFTHTGHQGPVTEPAPASHSDRLCRICRQPLASTLGDHGVHLLCGQPFPPRQYPNWAANR